MADPFIGGKRDETFTLNKFNPAEHDLVNKVILIIGPRESGKTFLTIDILYHLSQKGIPIGKIINGSEEVTGAYKAIAPDIIIEDHFNKDRFKAFVERQKAISNLKKFNPKYKNVDNRAFLVLDDLYYQTKVWVRDMNLQYCLNNGRHIGITLILAIQGLTEIPSKLKDVVDYVFLGRMTTRKQKDYIFNHYSCGFDDFKKFCKAINKGTEDNRFMVFHKTSKKNNFKDQVWWYKANDHTGLKIGHPSLWAYHGANYEPKYVERGIKEKRAKEQLEKLRKGASGGSNAKNDVVLKGNV